MSVEYHLGELQIALDPKDPRRAVPTIPSESRRVLDIGCGAGQTLIAADLKGASAFGIDFDLEALQLGSRLGRDVHLACASGEQLPFADGIFDFVFSRVALPYMRIPLAVGEIARVLRAGGQIWCSLHPLGMLSWRKALRSPQQALFEIYRLLNTAALGVTSFQFRYPLNAKWTESYQTPTGMRRCLERAGFEDIRCEAGTHFIVTARKTSPR